MSWLNDRFQEVLAAIRHSSNTEVLKAVAKLQTSVDRIEASVLLLADYLIPTPATRLVLTFTPGENMSKGTGKLKFVVQDDGTAVGTLTVLDSKGLPTSLKPGIIPTYSSNSAAVTATGSADGLSVTVAPVDPPVLADGIIITATAAGAAKDGTDLVADNADDPGSVVAGEAGKVVLKF